MHKTQKSTEIKLDINFDKLKDSYGHTQYWTELFNNLENEMRSIEECIKGSAFIMEQQTTPLLSQVEIKKLNDLHQRINRFTVEKPVTEEKNIQPEEKMRSLLVTKTSDMICDSFEDLTTFQKEVFKLQQEGYEVTSQKYKGWGTDNERYYINAVKYKEPKGHHIYEFAVKVNEILEQNDGNWPGNKSDIQIAKFMLDFKYKESEVKEALMNSPNHDAKHYNLEYNKDFANDIVRKAQHEIEYARHCFVLQINEQTKNYYNNHLLPMTTDETNVININNELQKLNKDIGINTRMIPIYGLEDKLNPSRKAASSIKDYQHHAKSFLIGETKEITLDIDKLIAIKMLTNDGYNLKDIIRSINEASPIASYENKNYAKNIVDQIQKLPEVKKALRTNSNDR